MIWLKKAEPTLDIVVHAPHNAYSRKLAVRQQHSAFRDVRYHYFWPFRFEILAGGRGILTDMRTHPWLLGVVPFFCVFQFLSLWKLAREEKPDLLYAHWFTPQAISCALVATLTGIPFIFTTHASDVSVLRPLPLSRQLVKWVCTRAGAYTAVSIRTADKLKSFFRQAEWHDAYQHKLTIIPMGVDVGETEINAGAQAHLKAQYALDDRPVVLFLGRLAEKKGVDILLRAFASLPVEIRRGFQLVIAGDGQLRPVLETLAAESGLKDTVFTGFVQGETKTVLLSLATFLCLPSIIDSKGDSEGLPVVLMEGLAIGKVVLASDVTGAENILSHGDNGFLFEHGSVEALAGLLVQLSRMGADRTQQLSRKARLLAQRFHWGRIAAEHLQVMRAASSIFDS